MTNIMQSALTAFTAPLFEPFHVTAHHLEKAELQRRIFQVYPAAKGAFALFHEYPNEVLQVIYQVCCKSRVGPEELGCLISYAPHIVMPALASLGHENVRGAMAAAASEGLPAAAFFAACEASGS